MDRTDYQILHILQKDCRATVKNIGDQVGLTAPAVSERVRRMEEKGIISHAEQGRAKVFSPALSREDVTTRETKNLLQRAYNGSVGLLLSAMAESNTLTKADIDELYEILKKAEEDAK